MGPPTISEDLSDLGSQFVQTRVVDQPGFENLHDVHGAATG
jgi:hypothetical protein